MFVRASFCKRREENQLDATEWFIALVICSTCFGHLYANHQELETILCYYRIWCVMPWSLVVGRQVKGSRLCVRDKGSCSTSRVPDDGHINARNMLSKL